jgi:hypothetical protein
MIGVRLPAKMIKKIGEVADALGKDCSATIRFMLNDAIEQGRTRILLLNGRGSSRFADQIVRSIVADQKAEFTEAAAARPGATPEAEIKALRAAEQSADLVTRLADKVELQRAHTPLKRQSAMTEIKVIAATPSFQAVPETALLEIRPSSAPLQRGRKLTGPLQRGKKLSKTEVRAAVERAVSRSSTSDRN